VRPAKIFETEFSALKKMQTVLCQKNKTSEHLGFQPLLATFASFPTKKKVLSRMEGMSSPTTEFAAIEKDNLKCASQIWTTHSLVELKNVNNFQLQSMISLTIITLPPRKVALGLAKLGKKMTIIAPSTMLTETTSFEQK